MSRQDGYYLLPETEEREREWLQATGQDWLPIANPVPAVYGPEAELCFSLSPGRLHPFARERLFSHLIRSGVERKEAARLLDPAGVETLRISASGVRVERPAGSAAPVDERQRKVESPQLFRE